MDWGQAEESIGLQFFDRQAGAEKSANVAIHQNWRTVFNALVMRIFANVPPQTQVDLVNAACGYDLTIAEMMKIGERGWTIKRAINNRLGLTRADDKLPKALLKPYKEGGAAGYVIQFAEMLEAYYEARGWDKVTGKPSKEKLGLFGICRDRPAYLVFGVGRIANPPHIWRYTTPIPNDPKLVELGLDDIASDLWG